MVSLASQEKISQSKSEDLLMIRKHLVKLKTPLRHFLKFTTYGYTLLIFAFALFLLRNFIVNSPNTFNFPFSTTNDYKINLFIISHSLYTYNITMQRLA